MAQQLTGPWLNTAHMAYVSVHWKWRHTAPSFRPPSYAAHGGSRQNPIFHDTILHTNTLILRTPTLIPDKIFSRALNATQPQNYAYPDPSQNLGQL